MPTMVELPQIQNAQVSNLQAIDRPNDTGLSTFMRDILPAAVNAVDQYQKENADRLIALGRSDQLNGIQRELGILDAKYYKQGTNYQKIVSIQAQQKKSFSTQVQELAQQGADPDKIFDVGQAYLKDSVDAIYNSDLDSDLKENLYNETIKENAVYQKVITDTMRKVAIDKEYESTLLMNANYTNDLLTVDMTPDQLDLFTNTYVNRSIQAKMAADPELTLKEASAAANNEVAGTFKFIAQQINPESPDAPRIVNKLRGMVDTMYTKGYMGLDTVTDIRKMADDIQVNVTKYNDQMVERGITDYIGSVEVGERPFDSNDINDQLQDIWDNPEISTEKKTALHKQLVNFHSSEWNKRMNAEVDVNTIDQYGDVTDFIADTGKGEDKWVSLWEQKYLKESGGDIVGAGLKMINHAYSGASDVPAMAKKGAEYVSSQFTGFMGMTQAEAEKDPFYKNREIAFNQMGAMYRNYQQTNPARASQLLAGVPDEYRGAVEQLFRNGGRMTDARELVRNPVNQQVRYNNIDKAIGNFTGETAKLDKWFGRGHGGGFWSKQKDEVKNSQLNAIVVAATAGKFQLAPSTTTASPELLMANMEALGMLHKSPSGYASTVLTPDAANVVRNFKTENGTPLSSDLLGITVDKYRKQIAANMKTRPEDIVVTSDESGSSLYFQAYNKEGQLVNVSGVAGMQGAQLTMNRLRSDMEKEYRNRGSKQQANTKTYSTGLVTGPSPTAYGSYMQKYGNTLSGGRAQPVTINRNASLGQVQLKLIGGRNAVVRTPATVAAPFNGNIELAQQLISNFNVFESFASQEQFVRGVGGSSSGNVYGHGIRMDKHPKWKARFDAAAGNPQEVLRVQGEFLTEYYNGMGNRLRDVGVPIPTQQAYPKQFKASVMLLADVWWHGGGGAAAQIQKAMNARTYQEGLGILKSMRVYAAGGDTAAQREKHQRNVFYRRALEQHFKATGRLV